MTITVTTTETEIRSDTYPFTLQNLSAQSIYLRHAEDSGPVTPANGFRLKQGESLACRLGSVFAVTEDASALVAVVSAVDGATSNADISDVQAVRGPSYTGTVRTGGATQPATSTGTIHTIEAGQKLMLQNVHASNVLFVKLGEGASTTSHDRQLGSQVAYVIEDYVGPVSVAGTSPSYLATLLY